MAFAASDAGFIDLPSGTDQDVDVTLNIGSPGSDGLVWLAIGFRNNQGHSITQVTMDPAGAAIAMTAGTANAGFLYARAFRADPGSLSGDVTFRVRVTGGANTAFQVPVFINVHDGLDLASHEEATGTGGSITGTPPLSTLDVGASTTGRTCFAFHFTRNAATPPAGATFTQREASSNGDNFYAVIGDLVSDADPEAMDVEWAGAAGNWQAVGASFAPASGGGPTEQSVSGSLAVSGALVKEKRQLLAGTASPTAALAKQAQRTLAGGFSTSATLMRAPAKSLTGSLSPAAALAAVRALLRAVDGSTAPAGTLARVTGKGAAGTVAPAGAVTKHTAKQVAGTTTPSGALLRGPRTLLAGIVTPGGTVAALRSYLRAFSGAVTPSGILTPLGILARAIAGTLSLGGALVKRPGKTVGGSVAPTGTATRAVWKLVGGQLTIAAVVSKEARKRFAATIPLTGVTVTVAGTFAQPGPHPLRIAFVGHGKTIAFVVQGKRIRFERHDKTIRFEP